MNLHLTEGKALAHCPGMKPTIICAQCGTVGQTKKVTPGSIGIELILWLFLIIPGLIYSVWRLSGRADVCKTCGSKEVLPLDTPRGSALFKQYHGSR